jgi:hypothetical protein
MSMMTVPAPADEIERPLATDAPPAAAWRVPAPTLRSELEDDDDDDLFGDDDVVEFDDDEELEVEDDDLDEEEFESELEV